MRKPGRRNTGRPPRIVIIPRDHGHVYRGGRHALEVQAGAGRAGQMPGYSAVSLGPGRRLAGPQ